MWRQRVKLLEVTLELGVDGFRGSSPPFGLSSRGRTGLGRHWSCEVGGSSSRGKHWVALWGNGDHGRLGLESSTKSRWEPTVCESLAEVEPMAVACGGAHTLVLTRDGRVFSAGLNDHGQVGVEQSHPTTSFNFVQVVRGLPDRCVHIAAGYLHSAAIADDGEVYVWGSNAHGQLGLGQKAERKVWIPTQIQALKGLRIQKLALGAQHSLAMSSTGEVFSWGNGQSGRLGHGQASGLLRFFRNTSEFLPRLIDSLRDSGIRDISAGLMHSACVDSHDIVYTFGSGRMFQLGLSSGPEEAAEPTPLEGLPAGRGVSCGGYHTGAVTRLGDLYMWGSNENGCLGFGYKHTDHARVPMNVPRASRMQNVVEVSCGWKHTCAVTDEGKVFAWGWGGSAGTYAVDGRSGGGQLGLGDEFDYNEPTLVPTHRMMGVQISCGFNHTAAILKEL